MELVTGWVRERVESLDGMSAGRRLAIAGALVLALGLLLAPAVVAAAALLGALG